MRKKLIGTPVQSTSSTNQKWLELENLSQVEVSSEEATYPIELAFAPDSKKGWRAAQPGEQIIRLLFDKPQQIKSIRLQFREQEQARTQEFLLRYSSDSGQSYRDILRQQYNFSPPDTSQQTEMYTVALEGVTTLELLIHPDIQGGNACASLASLQMA